MKALTQYEVGQISGGFLSWNVAGSIVATVGVAGFVTGLLWFVHTEKQERRERINQEKLTIDTLSPQEAYNLGLKHCLLSSVSSASHHHHYMYV